MISCPLCRHTMAIDGDKMVCTENNIHVVSIAKELDRYNSGEKGLDWLRARMKVRLGKMVHGR